MTPEADPLGEAAADTPAGEGLASPPCSTLLVAAVIDNGFTSGPSEVYLEKDGVKLQLNAEDWKELNATIKGERKALHSELESGEYMPKHSYVFNHSSNDLAQPRSEPEKTNHE